MRLWMVALLAGATALPLAGCQGEHTKAEKAPKVVETPKRKPGLWKQTMSIEGLPITQVASVCLDKSTDARLSWWAQQGMRSNCPKNDVSQQPDGSWAFSSSCDLEGGARVTSNGVATGDFQTSYKVRAETDTLGSPVPALNGKRTTVIDAVWVSECPEGMKPGEMELPDGRRVDMLALSERAPAQ